MDYFNFLDEFDSYNEWNNIQKKQKKIDDSLDAHYNKYPQRDKPLGERAKYPVYKDDRVNSPSHYTSGKQEAIDIIEGAVKDAPSAIYGMLHAQVLKYLLRVWLKDDPSEDLQKARWYLNRLIDHYDNPPGDGLLGMR